MGSIGHQAAALVASVGRQRQQPPVTGVLPPILACFCWCPAPPALPGHPDWADLIAAWLLLGSIKKPHKLQLPLKPQAGY